VEKLKPVKNLKDTLDPEYAPLLSLSAIETVTDETLEETRITLTFSHHLEVGKGGTRRETAGVKILRHAPRVVRSSSRSS
jgi:hypothetical protein